MFTDAQWEVIKNSVEGSAIWQETNARIDKLYKDNNRIPCKEEYEALRTMIMCKAFLEDEELMKKFSRIVWESLQ